MSDKKQFRAIKGVRDILPPESALWSRVEQTARDVFATYNFQEIRLPIFEQTELFARSVGADTEIVSKEMYTFEDRPTELAMPKSVRGIGPFILEAHELMQRGEIPNTEANRKAIESVKQAMQETYRARQKLSVKGRRSGNAIRAYTNTFLSAFYRTRSLQLGERLTMRPEATASVVRAYIEHGMQTWPSPVKLYYIGPMFRRERPQKGRYRQFYQIGAEVLALMKPGGYGWMEDAATDAEVIEMLAAFFAKVGLEGTTLYINSIGDRECRPKYVELVRAELQKVREKLGPDSKRRIETNPLRVLDSKVPSEQAIIEMLPRITEHLCEPCRDHYAELKRQLALRKIAYQENWRLVRGLDYYMRTTFEITAPGLGAQNAICGGGRYDGLVELLGGPPTKGIGFAIGTDRLVLSLQQQGFQTQEAADVLIAWKDNDSYDQARSLAWLLRDCGLVVYLPSKPLEPREGLGLANRMGIPIGVIVGPSEVSAGVFSVRLMAEREQVQFPNQKAEILGRLMVFRVLLEKALKQAARRTGMGDKALPPSTLVDELLQRRVLEGHIATGARQAFAAFDRVVHGEEVSDEESSRALANAVFVLQALTRAFGPDIPRLRY